MKNPLISVIITTHNRSTLLERAVMSVLNQSYTKTEIIVVDDGSTDNTDTLLIRLSSTFQNLIVLKNLKPMGANFSRNRGIKHARGLFVAGLDDDDEFTRERLSVLLKSYDDKYSFITSRSLHILKNSTIKSKYRSIIDLDTILYYNAVGNQILVKRDRIIKAGLFDESLNRFQDYDMWLRLIQIFGPAKCISKITQIVYQDHDIKRKDGNRNNFIGGLIFYNKHKYLMNIKQRRTRLFQLFILSNKRLTIKKLLLFLNVNNYKTIARYLIFPNSL